MAEEEKTKITILHLLSIIYFIVGVVLIVTASQSRYIPVHVCLVGVLNIIASCGVYWRRKWIFYMLIFISLINIVFGSGTLIAMINIFNQDPISILMFVGMMLYIVLFIILLVYTITKKNTFA